MKFLHFFLSFLLFFTISCTQAPQTPFPDYSFGVLETSNAIFTQTRVRLYNANGDSIHTAIVPKGGIYEGFITPSIGFKRFLYYPVQGTYTKGESALFRLDLLTGAFKVHEYDHGVTTILADDTDPDVIFFMDYKDKLIKWDDKNNKEITRQNLSGYFLEHIRQYKDKIYFFGFFNPDSLSQMVNSHILVLDKNTLSVEKKIDITAQGKNHFSSVIYNNTLFFTNNVSLIADQYLDNYTLSALDLTTHEITDYTLLEKNPYNIVRYKEQLIINHAMIQDSRMKKVSTFDLKTHETKLYKLAEDSDDGFNRIAVQGDFLYALSSPTLTKYDISNGFKEVVVYPIKAPFGNRKKRTFNNSSHISAFFLNPKNGD